jgi:DNA-binding XRE family transcriptional regulator
VGADVKTSVVPLSRVRDVPATIGGHRVRRARAIATFGERVRGRRLALGLSQAALAEAADISPDTLGKLERARHEPRAYTLAALAAALDTTMDALWHGGIDRSAQDEKNG